ncbi:DNA polymerase [Caligus rogercresseyi]|uniref:DNA polymerase n=1 Tax=Caligus rogercresseyi TaxID=217165 RepID=A0A7T8K7W2_CALRO|nr:DNA polymerase [Caligus rogercresseyi]
MRTVINPKSLQNEIVALSVVVHQDFPLERPVKAVSSSHLVALTRPNDVIWPFDIQKNSVEPSSPPSPKWTPREPF